MEVYHSTRNFIKGVPQTADTPFLYEYAAPGTEEFIPYTLLDEENFVPSNLSADVGGYQWILGFRVGENTLARSFIAPRDGLVSIAFEGGLRYWLADRETAALRFTHNGELLFPEKGVYPDDYLPLSNARFLTFPRLYRTVKKGDVLRFSVKTSDPESRDDVVAIEEIAYLFGGSLLREAILSPGEAITLPVYVTEGDVRYESTDPAVAAVSDGGRVTAVGEGAASLRLFFSDGSEDVIPVYVAADKARAKDPFALERAYSSTEHSPAAGLGVLPYDTLELAASLGEATTSHGSALTDAVREDRAGECVRLLEDGAFSETVEAAFLPSYTGGRTLAEVRVTMRADGDENYAVRLYYSTLAEPTVFRYFGTVENEFSFPVGRYVIFSLRPTDRAITDLYAIRAEFLRTDGRGISLAELDVSLVDESEAVKALRAELTRDFWLPDIFADGMMFQREKPIAVFGYSACEGAAVSVALTDAGGHTERTTATVENGKFKARLSPRAATVEGLTLTVEAFGKTVTYRDIWVGDLWVAAGQSNMGIGANWLKAQGYTEEHDAMMARVDEAAPLRMFTQMPQAGDHPCRNTAHGRWMTNTRENVVSFSAIGYFTTRVIQKELDVPMGIVYAALAGTWLQSWVDEGFLDGTEETDAAYLIWNRREALSREGWCRPLAPYYGMRAPLSGFPVAGVLWYQGSNNGGQPWKFMNYHRQLLKMIALWRRDFEDEALPFVIIQMLSVLCYAAPNLPKLMGGINNPAAVTDPVMLAAAEAAKPKTPSDSMVGYVTLREAQSYAEAFGKNILTVVAYDLSNRTHDVHPPNKLPLAERMGEQILGTFYGKKGLSHSPTFESVEEKNGGMLLRFAHADGGLRLSFGDAPRHFEVSDDGLHFRRAEACLTEDGIFVKNEGAPYVRHAFESCPVVNVYNRAGYPLAPFRASLTEGRIWSGPIIPRVSD